MDSLEKNKISESNKNIEKIKIDYLVLKEQLSSKLNFDNDFVDNIILNIEINASSSIKKEVCNKIDNLLSKSDIPEVIESAKRFFSKIGNKKVEKFSDVKDENVHIAIEYLDSIIELNSNSRSILLNCLNLVLKKQLKNNFSDLNKFIDDDFRIMVDYERFGEGGLKIKNKTLELHEQFGNNKKNITNPELFEIFKTCLLNEFFGSKKYLTSRSSLSDDYMSGVDNVIFNTETNRVLFAFDELVQYGDDRLIEKDEKIEKRNKFGGVSPMFIPKKRKIPNLDVEYINVELNVNKEKYPIFCLYIDKHELLTGIKLIIKKYLLEQDGKEFSSQLNVLKEGFVVKFRKEIEEQQKYITNAEKISDIDEFIKLLE